MEGLSFGYLLSLTDGRPGADLNSETASEFAFENGLLFNELAINGESTTSADLVLKTLLTRTARLVGEVGADQLPKLLSEV